VEDLPSFFGLEIDSHAFFAPVKELEVQLDLALVILDNKRGAVETDQASLPVTPDRLDLDNVGAPIRHDGRRGGEGHYLIKGNDFYAFQ